MNESTIAKRIKEGDVSAYEELFSFYYRPLCGFASRIINDKERARDLVQDLFVTLYVQRASLDIHTSIKSYLFKALNNRCLNELRQVKSHALHFDELKKASSEVWDQDELAHEELQTRLLVAIDILPEQCARIFKLSRFQGKKNGEIAQELNLSIRTVETQISKALTILRVQLVDFLCILFLISL